MVAIYQPFSSQALSMSHDITSSWMSGDGLTSLVLDSNCQLQQGLDTRSASGGGCLGIKRLI